MKTMLVPLDGSVIAEQVLPHIRILARLLPARVRLIRIVSEEEVAHLLVNDGAIAHEVGDQAPVRQRSTEELRALLHQHAANYLTERAMELRTAGLDVDIAVCDGWPAEQIVEVAEHDQVSLIAMSTHGYSGLRRWALGSVADKVVRAATTPIFLVRAVEQPPSSVRPWRCILVPLDGSAYAEQALPFGIELAARTQAELVLLHAVVPLVELVPVLSPFSQPPSPAMFPDLRYEQAHEQLAGTISRLGSCGAVLTPAVVFGDPAGAIVDVARERQADLIVMATHGYSGLRRWALGSVADKVLHASTTPLLLMRSWANQQVHPGGTET